LVERNCVKNASQLVAQQCVQCERFQQHSRTQVEQLVASVKGSIEIHGEYKFSNKFSNLIVWQLVWQHVACSVKALLQCDAGGNSYIQCMSRRVILYNS